ncbi:hypothetical protein C8R45DRAFT_1223511 [Mycena sanguinolenta]|nr:hypothetical protein C8R45DRAFT_1223511 [Mycena sanguinolenta]
MHMVSKISVAFLLAASLFTSAHGAALDARAACAIGGTFCFDVPCCPGLFCGIEQQICGACVATGRSGCSDFPCCTGLCGEDDFCH